MILTVIYATRLLQKKPWKIQAFQIFFSIVSGYVDNCENVSDI